MRMNRPKPWNETIVTVAATELSVTARGERQPGLRAVLWEFLSYDENKLAGGTIQDLRVKIIPQFQNEAMGGDAEHNFYGQPTPNTSNRNTIPLGFFTRSDEDVVFKFTSATGGTFRVMARRVLIFDPETKVEFYGRD